MNLQPPCHRLGTCASVEIGVEEAEARLARENEAIMADAWMPILVPTDKYKYTPIKDIKIGAVQNVYGIVQSVNGPSVTKSGLDMMTLRLIDDSCIEEVNGEETYKFLPCVLYGSVRIDLPQVDVGDIVRFHRLVVKNYQGLAQGKMAAGFSW